MAGLLDMQVPQAQQASAMPPQGGMVPVDQIQGQTAATMDKLKKIVVAGKMMLYSPKTSDQFSKYIDPNDLEHSAAVVVSLAMASLIQRGEAEAFPPDLVMPAGVVLVADYLDWLASATDTEVTEEMANGAVIAFAEAMSEGVKGQGQQPAQPAMQQQPMQQGGV